MRLDVYLATKGLVDSRTDAKKFVVDGAVTVNGVIVNKPSYDILGDEVVLVDKSGKRFVSRGGLKLEAALDAFGIDVTGMLALDIGASSGGFTDCLLQRGASKVIAVDAGSGQMAEALRQDKRVVVIENYNARYMSPEDFHFIPDIAVMDVSFISAKMIFSSVNSVLPSGGHFVCLIKPQFEVGKKGLNKKGIVKNDSLRHSAVKNVIEFADCCSFELIDYIQSPITGGDGNIEYLAYFRKRA